MSDNRVPDEGAKCRLGVLDRLIESQRSLASAIEEANPGDPYAALMVLEDIGLLAEIRCTLANADAPHETCRAQVSDVTAQLIARDQTGRTKYGTTLDRQDLSHADWLQHMAEELLDAAGYALAAKAAALREQTELLSGDLSPIAQGFARKESDLEPPP